MMEEIKDEVGRGFAQGENNMPITLVSKSLESRPDCLRTRLLQCRWYDTALESQRKGQALVKSPGRVQVPVKHGLRESMYIDEHNLYGFSLTEPARKKVTRRK